MFTHEESAVLDPLLGALTDQKAGIRDVMDLLHDSINQLGQVTWIPHLQSRLRELLTEHAETIDNMEALMLTEGLGCWFELEMAQQEGEYLIKSANRAIQSANAYLRDTEDLASDPRHQPAEKSLTKMTQVQPQPKMEDTCLAMRVPTHEVAEDNLQVKDELHVKADTAAYSPTGT